MIQRFRLYSFLILAESGKPELRFFQTEKHEQLLLFFLFARTKKPITVEKLLFLVQIYQVLVSVNVRV